MNDPWFLRPWPNTPTRLRLFCFHPAGRGASSFVPWARLLPAGFELCCIQLPGRENRLKEAPISNLSEIISTLNDKILPLLDRPFVIFGASMGALVGFELARKLRSSYQLVPEHLFLASRRAPQNVDRLPPISHLADDAFLQAVQNRYNSIPEVIRQEKELMDIFLPEIRADFKVIETYTYESQEPLDCPLTILRGSDDSVVLPEDITGWGSHTMRKFDQRTYSGGHFFFNDHPGRVVDLIVQQLGIN